MQLKSITAIALGILMLLAGAALGWWAASRYFHARLSMGAMGESAAFAQIAAAQYDNANYDAARTKNRFFLRAAKSGFGAERTLTPNSRCSRRAAR
jgi:Flp pilus assembly protein TadG